MVVRTGWCWPGSGQDTIAVVPADAQATPDARGVGRSPGEGRDCPAQPVALLVSEIDTSKHRAGRRI